MTVNRPSSSPVTLVEHPTRRSVTVLRLRPARARQPLARLKLDLAQPLGLHHGDLRDVGYGDHNVTEGGPMADAELRADPRERVPAMGSATAGWRRRRRSAHAGRAEARQVVFMLPASSD